MKNVILALILLALFSAPALADDKVLEGYVKS